MNSLTRCSAATVCLFLACLSATGRAEEKTVRSKTESVSLFKNGLAVVDRSVHVDGPGTYRIDDVPNPVHGTFFVESPVGTVVRMTTQLVEIPANLAGGDSLQDGLAGLDVTITLRDDLPSVTGKVMTIEKPEAAPTWGRQYEQPAYPYYAYNGMRDYSSASRAPGMSGPAKFMVLETEEGRSLVDMSLIASVDVHNGKDADANVIKSTAKVRKPVLLLTLPDNTPPDTTIHLTYLTKGMAWAPSYRVTLLEGNRLTVQQSAVIRNELAKFEDVQTYLISGFPSVDFSNVTSPFSPEQTWERFFAQLTTRSAPRGGSAAVTQQTAIMYNAGAGGPRGGGDGGANDLPNFGSDETIDVHYQPVGRLTFDAGDAIALDVGKAEAKYERLVEWVVPDNRDSMGRYNGAPASPEANQDNAWDTIRFANPLPFPMTTAPAMFMQEGKFLGQTLSKWVSSGEQTTLHITKALSVRTRATEEEDADIKREEVRTSGQNYQKIRMKGELTLTNLRNSETIVTIKRQFSGELVDADEKPLQTLREEGIWSINRRNELEWTLTLKPGEERTLKYQYSVLVYR